MATQTLVVNFRGVCTHFHHNYVPGIPHRVVLPDATPAIPGLLTGPWLSDPTDPGLWDSYLLMPHFPMIVTDPPEAASFTTSGLIDILGTVITPCRMEILNAIDPTVTYPDGVFMSNVPQLTTYFAGYTPSDDVVVNGRASAYFDISAGVISSDQSGANVHVTATIQTDGPPQLRISALSTEGLPVPTVTFPLPSSPTSSVSTLLIGNIGLVCDDGRSKYDFLLHYLTSTVRIPRSLTQATPGMSSGDLCPATPREALIKLADSGYPKTPHFQADFDTSAACSDSRYP